MRTCESLIGRPAKTETERPIVSVIIVSFNTRDVLRQCLECLGLALTGLDAEIIVLDNNSRDGSCEMVAHEFPDVNLLKSSTNLGFAGANNIAFSAARGQYFLLLNSDAFVAPEAIRRAVQYMEGDSTIGAGGGRLVGRDGSWQPSVRLFPSVMNDFLTLSGLAHKFPKSRFFGRFDRTWADPLQPGDADWVPGAFSIIRAKVLSEIGYFDEAFFLYYEEVDLCRRLKLAGYRICYWPDVVVVHIGGESSKTHRELHVSNAGAQLTTWRLRSQFLYYRKHHGSLALLAMLLEWSWHRLRLLRNSIGGKSGAQKANSSRSMMASIEQAWRETRGGRISPLRPW